MRASDLLRVLVQVALAHTRRAAATTRPRRLARSHSRLREHRCLRVDDVRANPQALRCRRGFVSAVGRAARKPPLARARISASDVPRGLQTAELGERPRRAHARTVELGPALHGAESGPWLRYRQGGPRHAGHPSRSAIFIRKGSWELVRSRQARSRTFFSVPNSSEAAMSFCGPICAQIVGSPATLTATEHMGT